MKKEVIIKSVLLLSLSVTFGILKAQTTVSSSAKVKEVTIYTSGAEVTNRVTVNLPKGSSTLVVQNVSRDFDIRSVQVSGPDGITVLSISQTQNQEGETVNAAHKRLKDSLDLVLERRELLINKQSAAQGALNILSNDQLLGGDTKLQVADLSKLVDYYQVKSVELKSSISALAKSIVVEDKVIKRLQEQLKVYTGEGGQMMVQMSNSKAIQGELQISYMTHAANWQAYYDLRAQSITSPLDIFYKAKVTQWTGVDWKNVKLTLSTGNPSQSGTAPLLSPSYASYFVATGSTINRSVKMQNRIQSLGSSESKKEEALDAVEVMGAAAPVTTMSENQLSATFDIEVPYDIPSNGEPQSVTLKEFSHPALFKYYAVPKVDKDAFLLAEVTDFEKLNLVPGEANIIFENMFVGSSIIDPSVTIDTLNLSMGRDKSISIKRERVMDAKSTQVSGGSKKQTYTYEIRVRNSKKSTVNMLLKDQYPISTDKSIETELVDRGGANVNSETGVMTWMISVKPGETQTFRFTFTVKHPKDRNVVFN